MGTAARRECGRLAIEASALPPTDRPRSRDWNRAMPRRPAQPPPAAPAAAPADEPDRLALETADETDDRVVSRPDGYYWIAPDGHQEIGPFATLAEALADMDSGDAGGWAPGETLAEAESELGVSDWIDPDSGELAEGQARPHLSE